MITFRYTIVATSLLVWLDGCASSQRFAQGDGEVEKPPPGVAKKDEPGPRSALEGKVLLTLEGVASYYAEEFHGKQTSNGEMFDMHSYTAAHRTFPFDTMVRVTNLANGKTVMVRINDRGPFVDGRIIDVSFAAARELGLVASGTARVRLEVLKWGDGTLKHK
jgi:hypothetical protein